MAVKIQLTPQELLSQSQEMLSLQKDFETLFGQSQTLLNQVNENWSANLSNNFAGKILSAQKGFGQITSMLEAGGNLAAESARTYESVDSLLARNISGEAGIVGLGGSVIQNIIGSDTLQGSVQGVASGVGGWLAEQWEQAQNAWNYTGDFLEWVNENYQKLPDWMQEKIEGALGKRNNTAISMTYDIITGNAGWDTAKTFVKYVVESKPDALWICNSLKMFFGKDYQNWGAHWGRRFEQYFKEGDLLAGIMNAGGAIMTNFALGITDSIVSTGVDIVTSVPILGAFAEYIGINKTNWDKFVRYTGNDMKETYDQVAQAIARGEEFVQEKVSQAVDAAKEAVSDLYEGAKETVSDLYEGAKDKVSDVMDSIREANKGVVHAAKEAKETVKNVVGDALDNVKDAVCFWNKKKK